MLYSYTDGHGRNAQILACDFAGDFFIFLISSSVYLDKIFHLLFKTAYIGIYNIKYNIFCVKIKILSIVVDGIHLFLQECPPMFTGKILLGIKASVCKLIIRGSNLLAD